MRFRNAIGILAARWESSHIWYNKSRTKGSLLMDHNNFNASSSTKTEEIIKEQAATQEKSCCSNDNATPSAPACCCTRHTDRSEADRKKLINRLKRIEGQIRGIIGMLENDAYCNDILIQSAAVNAAVNSFNKELLANHIRTCVARDIREGKDETIDELVATLQKLMK